MKAGKWLLAVALGCLMAGNANAEWMRTVYAWDTRTPAQGKFQVTLSGSYQASESEGNDATRIVVRPYGIYGLADNWAVRVAPAFVSWDVDGGGSESGLGDTRVLTVYRFLDEAQAGFDLAVKGGVSLPTGDDDQGLGTGNVEPDLALLAAKTLGPVIAVANAGGRLILDPDEGEEDFILDFIFAGICPLNEKTSLNVELEAATARWDGEDDYMELLFGGRFLPRADMFVKGGVSLGLTDAFDWGFRIAGGYEF